MAQLEREIQLSRPRDEIFPFFANAENLDRLTPPWLRLEILTPPPIAMRTGTRIDYRLRLHRIPLRWTSLISAWEPPHRFVDEQVVGPYRRWIHEHTFDEVDGHAVVCDRVRYDAPGGRIVDRLLVRPDLERLFDFRHEMLRSLFG